MKILPVSLLALLLAAPAALAEVCAVFDLAERFERLDIVTDEKVGLIWTQMSSRPDGHCLNVDGDRLGDARPTWSIVYMPDLPLVDRPRARPAHRRIALPGPGETTTPVLVWPRNDGNDWELIYSMWDYDARAWRDTFFVERFDNPFDDIEPALELQGDNTLDSTWRRTDGTSTYVMYSKGTLVSVGTTYDIHWTTPIAISVDEPLPGVSPTSGGGTGSVLILSSVK